jgi:acetyltransferase-like isoleucine patch superfamily enzyme
MLNSLFRFAYLAYCALLTAWRRCFYRHFSVLVDYCFLRFHGVETGWGDVWLGGFPIISRHPGSRIVLGRGVKLVSHSRYNAAGVNHPVILATLARDAVIQIGDGTGMSGNAICAVQAVRIGPACGLGANAAVYDTDFHPLDPEQRLRQQRDTDAPSAPVRLGARVWLGANSLVLKGVTIGEGAVIAAGAIVTKDVPPNALAGGVPAKILRILKSGPGN